MKKALKIIGNVLLWIFIAFSAVTMVFSLSAASSKDGVPSVFGKSLITVQSDSMKPVFKKGDLIIDSKLSNEEKLNLKVGDVITFKSDLDGDGDMELNTHRIIGIMNEGQSGTQLISYKTQGDNNPLSDAEVVVYSMVVGKFNGTVLKGVGSFIDFLQSRVGFLVLIVLPLAAFFIYELVEFILVIKKLRPQKATANISADEEERIKQLAIEEYKRQLAEEAKNADVNTSNEEDVSSKKE